MRWLVTWEEENNILTKEEFVKRLSITKIHIDEEGMAKVWIDLDDMFTDHCYCINVYADGRLDSYGLWG